jgi:hypothetical protein
LRFALKQCLKKNPSLFDRLNPIFRHKKYDLVLGLSVIGITSNERDYQARNRLPIVTERRTIDQRTIYQSAGGDSLGDGSLGVGR